MGERQQLETLRREQKTLRDALASAEDKIQQAERQKAKLSSEIDQLGERDQVVCTLARLTGADVVDEREG